MTRYVALLIAGLCLMTACSDDPEQPRPTPSPAPDAVPSFVGEWQAAEGTDIGVSNAGHVFIACPFVGIHEYSAVGDSLDLWKPVSSFGGELWPIYMEITSSPFGSNYYIVSALPEPSRIVVFGAHKVWKNEWSEKYDESHDGYAGGVDQIAVSPEGDVYRLRFNEESVIKYSASGVFEREWLAHGSVPSAENWPGGIAATEKRVYVSDTLNNRILIFSPTGLRLDEFGALGTAPGQFNWPTGLAIQDQILYVVDRVNRRVQKFDLDGHFLAQFPDPDEIGTPDLIAVHGLDLYTYHVETGMVRHFRYHG